MPAFGESGSQVVIEKMFREMGLELSDAPPSPEVWSLLRSWESVEEYVFPLPGPCMTGPLDDAREHLRAFDDAVDEIVFQTDANGLWTYLGDAWTAILGYPPDESLGRLFLDFVHPGDRARNTAYFAPLIDGRKAFCRHQVRYLAADGSYRWVEVHARLVRGPDGTAIGTTGILRDVSRLHAAQEEAARRGEMLAGIAAATEALLVTPEFDRALALALQALGRASAVDRVGLFQLHADGQDVPLVSLIVEWVRDGVRVRYTQERLQGLAMEETFAGWYPILSRGDAAGGTVARMSGRAREFFDSAGTRSILALPILIEGALWGFVSFHHYSADIEWDAAERAVLRAMAGNLAGALRRNQVEEQLRDAKAEAIAANAVKSVFLGTMSHELRTPLNAIIGLSDTIDGREDAQVAAREINAAGRTLLAMVDSVLDSTLLAAGRLVLEQRTFDVPACLGRAVESLRPEAQRKGLALDLALSSTVPASAVGDERRIAGVLVNLVGNALKFTHRGGVRIEASATCGQDCGRCTLFVTVRDTGIGIEPENLESIFEPFVQVDTRMQREYGGSGLGLSTSRRIVQLMGGRVWATSDPGAGSSFHVSVTLGCANSACAGCTVPRATERVLPPRAPGRVPLRVLLVDDNEINLKVGRRMVERIGHHVDVARNGVEALEVAARAHYDVVLMDINMPEMDGLEASRRLRANVTPGAPRIVALTALHSDADRLACFSAGMDDCVTKPVQLEELRRVLDAGNSAAK